MADILQNESPGAVGAGRFVRNCWYVAAWAKLVPAGELVPRTVLGEPIVLFRREDGSVAVIPDTCPHRFAPLSMGKILPGDRVQCPYHGLEFAADGRCVHNPHGSGPHGTGPHGTGPHGSGLHGSGPQGGGIIPASAHLRSIAAVERHSVIWVWLGEKPPTPETIPDFGCLDSTPDLFVTEPGYLLMQAGYELIVDNLLDLSHTSYLHDGILGNSETVHATISVVQKGDVISVARPASNVTTPGLLRSLATWEDPRGDQVQTIEWFAPSCLSLKTGVVPVGQPEEAGTGFYAIHFLTPETDRTTHYFFTAARFNVLTEGVETNEAIRANIAKMRRFAFAEQDAPVIEAQQRRIDLMGALRPTLLTIDAGPVQYRRVLERMLAADGI